MWGADSAARSVRTPRTIWSRRSHACSSGRSSGSNPAPRACRTRTPGEVSTTTWKLPPRRTARCSGCGSRSISSSVQYYDVEVAAKKDGTLLGMRVTQYLDVGAYCAPFSAFQTVACLMAGGAYKRQGISSRTVGVLTHKVPTDPYRRARRPEANHLVETMVDLVA